MPLCLVLTPSVVVKLPPYPVLALVQQLSAAVPNLMKARGRLPQLEAATQDIFSLALSIVQAGRPLDLALLFDSTDVGREIGAPIVSYPCLP